MFYMGLMSPDGAVILPPFLTACVPGVGELYDVQGRQL